VGKSGVDIRRPSRRLVVGCSVLGVLGLWAASGRGPVAADATPKVDFAREVQPILAASCVRCHAAGLEQGKLRLDTHQGLLRGGASGPVIVAGDGRASALFRRLVIDDLPKRMPWLSDPLPATAIETVRRWIDEGAVWPEGVIVAAVAPPAVAPPVPRPAAPSATLASGSRLSFNEDVRPILAGNCYACHGPDRNNRQAGLRLDREEAAKAPLASGHVAIVPGAPERSALVQRITDPDEKRRMPHVSSGKGRLSRAQIDTLRQWIEEGAPWQPHWSYIPPTRSPLPPVKRRDWGKNPVDAFILAGIESQAVHPSPEAEPRSACSGRRRMSLIQKWRMSHSLLVPARATSHSYSWKQGCTRSRRAFSPLTSSTQASTNGGSRSRSAWALPAPTRLVSTPSGEPSSVNDAETCCRQHRSC